MEIIISIPENKNVDFVKENVLYRLKKNFNSIENIWINENKFIIKIFDEKKTTNIRYLENYIFNILNEYDEKLIRNISYTTKIDEINKFLSVKEINIILDSLYKLLNKFKKVNIDKIKLENYEICQGINFYDAQYHKLIQIIDDFICTISKKIFYSQNNYIAPSIINKDVLNEIGYDLNSQYIQYITSQKNNINLDFVLNPALCIHCYPKHKNSIILENEVLVDMIYGVCFRNEENNYNNYDRFREFHMREIVFFGSNNSLEQYYKKLMGLYIILANFIGNESKIELATDMFFDDNESKNKIFSQLFTKSKIELKLKNIKNNKYTSISSINKHDSHFSKNLNITIENGNIAKTMCIGFGIERIINIILDNMEILTYDFFEKNLIELGNALNA